MVLDNAYVMDHAIVDNSIIYNNSIIARYAMINNNSLVENSIISGMVIIDDSWIRDNSIIIGEDFTSRKFTKINSSIISNTRINGGIFKEVFIEENTSLNSNEYVFTKAVKNYRLTAYYSDDGIHITVMKITNEGICTSNYTEIGIDEVTKFISELQK